MQTITLQVSDASAEEAQSLCEALGQNIEEWLAAAFEDALTRQKIRKRNIDAVEAAREYMPVEGGGSELRPRPEKEVVR